MTVALPQNWHQARHGVTLPPSFGGSGIASCADYTLGRQNRRNRMIQLVGPGAAGKTTIGAALARRLGVRFVDMDSEFMARHGNISTFLGTHGYDAYAERNVDLYADLVVGQDRSDVVALSSGFMTYRQDVHPDYAVHCQQISSSRSTFVLLPSVHFEACVTETVRRQLRRPFARSAEREELVIRARYAIYFGLSARKVETMAPLEAVVAELVNALAAQQAAV